ncbi:MAG: TetR/AcrR family transcriptional regulator [Proteobacteria bacterium]|nr:TetR/AcrR family transcriptional regulator [Pseudomonadota bacterium]
METNMNDIAAAAKLSKGGLYHYFSSKDEILFFLLDNYMDLVLEDLESQLQAFRDSTLKMQFIIERHLDLYSNHIAEARTLLHDAHCLSSKHHKQIADKERAYYRIVTKVLSEFFESSGDIKTEELKVLAFLLFGMCNWTYHWYDPKGPITPERLSRMIWTVFLNGITEHRQGKSQS